MRSRLELHDILVEILGSRCVYFQPPEKVKMNYPCIVYELSKIKSTMADNKRYLNTKRYRSGFEYTRKDVGTSL